jgi:hypothetical protein
MLYPALGLGHYTSTQKVPYLKVGVDVKVILTPPCIFCVENH